MTDKQIKYLEWLLKEAKNIDTQIDDISKIDTFIADENMKPGNHNFAIEVSIKETITGHESKVVTINQLDPEFNVIRNTLSAKFQRLYKEKEALEYKPEIE